MEFTHAMKRILDGEKVNPSVVVPPTIMQEVQPRYRGYIMAMTTRTIVESMMLIAEDACGGETGLAVIGAVMGQPFLSLHGRNGNSCWIHWSNDKMTVIFPAPGAARQVVAFGSADINLIEYFARDLVIMLIDWIVNGDLCSLPNVTSIRLA